MTADHLEPVARRWAAYRQGWGHNTAVVRVSEVAAGRLMGPEEFLFAFRHRLARFRRALPEQHVVHVLLLGDAEPWSGVGRHQPVNIGAVPTQHWQQQFFTDAPYADLDADGAPDVAIGRMPVSTIRQAEAVLDKVVLYESSSEPGTWRNHLIFFASEGGFGTLVDSLLELVAFELAKEIPNDWTLTVTHARKGSPYALPPRLYSDRLYHQMNQGALMAVYLGHGYKDSLEDVNWGPDDRGPILDTDKLSRFRCGSRCPILVLVACHAGDFARGTSLAERILAQPLAPLAVLAATEESHPFPNALLVRELNRQILKAKRPTLGEAFLRAVRGLARSSDPVRRQLEAVASLALTPEERRDLLQSHLRLYALLGDPAMRLPFRDTQVTLEGSSEAPVPGQTFTLCGQVRGPSAGWLTLTLETPRTDLARKLAPVDDQSPRRDRMVEANWARANDKVVLRRTARYSGGGFTVRLRLPMWLTPGKYILRAVTSDGLEEAVGTSTITIRSPR